MPYSRITAPPHPERYQRRPQGRRQGKSLHRHARASGFGHRPRPYQVGEFVGAYLTTILTFIAMAGLLAGTGEALALPVIVPVYLGCGVALSRFLHHRVRWFRQTANIAAVVQVKLHTITSWPVSVPVFIVQVAISKHL